MTAEPPLGHWARIARRRAIAGNVLLGAPVVLVVVAAVWRMGGVSAALVAAALATVALAVFIHLRTADLGRSWLVRRLDARRGDMEDSAALLLANENALSPLQRLQRARLASRLGQGDVGDLIDPWPMRAIAIIWVVALAVSIALIVWPRSPAPAALAQGEETGPIVPGAPRLIGQMLRIEPPAYTGLPPRDAPTLDARAPERSRLRWTFRFAPQPTAADLVMPDGSRLPLARAGDDWSVARPLERSFLYRVVAQGGSASGRLHRIEAIPDQAPRIRAVTPSISLTVAAPGQARWLVRFEASDDYGVAPNAALRLIVAEGEGENVKFRERTIGLVGSGPATKRLFTASLDFAALSFVAGSDLIAQLTVHDTRVPDPHVVRGPSVILRWPSAQGEGSGLEAMARATMPAYFRSQRQIIIDAQALLKDRPRLEAARYLARSDGIGADQRILRLRYGQFLGEEQEGKAKPPPTSDALPTADADHDAPPVAEGPPAFGDAGNITAEYGHVHDESEAATLLDPETRTTLRAALDQMWQSEVNLRQGHPEAALPFAFKALRLIKQVQQATRLFVGKVGEALPPIDFARRMTGKRDGVAGSALSLAPQPGDDAAPATVWRALAGPGAGLDGLDALDRWLAAHPGRVSDPLSIAAAIDGVRQEPNSPERRAALRGLLWGLLDRPPAGLARRTPADPVGQRYLDALR